MGIAIGAVVGLLLGTVTAIAAKISMMRSAEQRRAARIVNRLLEKPEVIDQLMRSLNETPEDWD